QDRDQGPGHRYLQLGRATVRAPAPAVTVLSWLRPVDLRNRLRRSSWIAVRNLQGSAGRPGPVERATCASRRAGKVRQRGGAEGGIRTHNPLRGMVFETIAYPVPPL